MKKLLALLVALMMTLAGLAWWVSAPRESTPEDLFTLASVEHGAVVETVSATGVLGPQDVIPVGTELGGKVVEVAADFNQVVAEGDLLFRLDDRIAGQKLRQAEVAVRVAKSDLDRARAVLDAARRATDRLRELPESVSLRKDLDAAEAQQKAAEVGVEVSEARVREAEEGRNLADLGVRLTRVHVPVLARNSAADSAQGVGSLAAEGSVPPQRRKFTVLERKVELNQQVGPPSSAQAFLLAGDLSQMRVTAQVAEGDIGRVRRGQRAEFTVASYADEVRFGGRVTDLRLVPTNDHGAVFYKVLIEATNAHDPASGEWQLRPGLTASVEIVVRKRDHLWKVPLAALNLEMPEEHISEAARAKMTRWRSSADRDHWQTVWVPGEGGKPWPVLARVANSGETAIRDVQWAGVIEWEPETTTRPDPKASATYPRVIVGAAPAKGAGLFSLPKIKI